MPVRDTSAISQPSGNERRDWHQARTPRRAHLGPVELYTPKGEKPRVLRRHHGHDVVAQRDAPPRVGRVPAVVAYGSWPHVAVGPGLAQTDRLDGADAALARLGAPGPQAEDAQAAGVGGSRVNVLAADVRANRDFCVDALTYRLCERIELNDGSGAVAWRSTTTITAHEPISIRDAHGRLHHLAS